MKKLIFLIGICLIFINCGPKFDQVKATDIIKQSFKLTAKDSLEILGISMESKEVALVKFKLNEVQIFSKIRKYDKGWQLDQIQNELGAWVPAESVINLITGKKKEREAMLDIIAIATGIAMFITDKGSPPKQDG